MQNQISIDELLRESEPPVKVEVPVARNETETVYSIPDDVFAERCKYCVHKMGSENIPIPLWAVHKRQYENIIPCKIMAISRPNDRPGECMSFAPRIDVYGICATCKGNSFFHNGFCLKENHGKQRRVFYGTHYGGDARKIDYYARHRLSVCDDYEPNQYVKTEGR